MSPLAVFLDMALAEVVVALSRSLLNGTLNESASAVAEGPSALVPWAAVIVSLVLGLIILIMVVGNLFVILAILLERDLQRPQYYLILSLAVADLMVGVVVSPLASVYEVERSWRLGVGLCDFWISADVLACTSSILHLVAIAIDRYSSITDIMYSQRRTPKRIFVMLAVVWVTSLLISVAPILGWKDAKFEQRVLLEKSCLISQDLGYQLFSTMTAFYGPLILIIVIYWKIFKAARKRIRKGRQRMSAAHTLTSSTIPMAQLCAGFDPKLGTSSTANGTAVREVEANSKSQLLLSSSSPALGKGGVEEDSPSQTLRPPPEAAASVAKRRLKESAEAKRERKAWRTLAIITGTFVVSWLPFFILAIARPICSRIRRGQSVLCEINPIMESVFLWLGYMNSALNPIIYTIFSPDFRLAFKRIIKRLCFLS